MKLTWKLRLARAKVRKTFTQADRDAAGWWNTCAVGEHKGEYTTREVLVVGVERTAPDDSDLRQLGNDFDLAVMTGDVPGARRVYKAIQAYFKKAPAAT